MSRDKVDPVRLSGESADGSSATPIDTSASTPAEAEDWYQFAQTANMSAMSERASREATSLLKKHPSIAERYCCLTLCDAQGDIGSFEADRIFRALKTGNADHARDILLLLLSPGGRIEPAYQISKLCKKFSAKSFIVAIPREAKSAATLIAIGADEIHMGPLGELGPIDPQIGGLPALGVKQALKTIASLSEQHPGSAEMFAQYLRLALTVEQIGYCERISESATQYAERLLSTKPSLVATAPRIARDLVYEYKHHGFVIDPEEAQARLGPNWVKTSSPELDFAEEFYGFFHRLDLCLGIHRKSRVYLAGLLGDPPLILDER